MKRYEALETLFSKTDLSFAQRILNEPYHPEASGTSRTDLGKTTSAFSRGVLLG